MFPRQNGTKNPITDPSRYNAFDETGENPHYNVSRVLSGANILHSTRVELSKIAFSDQLLV